MKASVHLDNDAIMARLKKLTPLAKAMMIPTLTEEEIKVALGEDEVTTFVERFSHGKSIYSIELG